MNSNNFTPIPAIQRNFAHPRTRPVTDRRKDLDQAWEAVSQYATELNPYTPAAFSGKVYICLRSSSKLKFPS